MQFILERKEYLEALVLCSKCTQGEESSFSLSRILHRFSEEGLTLISMDGENIMLKNIDVLEGDGDFSILVDHYRLIKILSEIHDKYITLSFDDNEHTMVLGVENGKYVMPTFGRDYPNIGDRIGNDGDASCSSITVKPLILKDAMTRAISMVSTDNLRPVLCCVCFDGNSDGVNIVGADICGASISSIKTLNASPFKGLIFSKSAKLCLKLLSSEDSEDIKIVFGEKYMRFITPTSNLYCQLIHSPYPNYGAMLVDGDKSLTIDKDMLLSAIKRVSAFSGALSSIIKMDIRHDGKIEVSTSNKSFKTSASETVDCEYAGEDTSICFDVDKMKKILSGFNKECNIIINFTDHESMVTIKPSKTLSIYSTSYKILPMIPV